MLRLNQETSATTQEGEPIVWKVLVLDTFTQAIISPILRVSDLRTLGVTVHTQLHGDRPSLPDVPAVYFVEPTPDNIRRIADDLSAHLYDQCFLNFSNTLPRQLLEDLAASTARSQSSDRVAQVYDQYLSFVSLDANLFSLEIPQSYQRLNDPRSSEFTIDALVDRIVSGLFAVAVTMEAVPVIRCKRGGAAEQVARRLDSRLRDHVKDGGFRDTATRLQRPLLVITDRSLALAPMLSHAWTYQALAHDVLGMKLNRLSVPVGPLHLFIIIES